MDLLASITIYEPDASWRDQFKQEREFIEHAFGSQLVSFHHVGSTAIDHLASRAIFDVIVEVVNLASLDPLMVTWHKLHLQDGGSRGGINYRFFRRLPPKTPMHLHVFEQGDPQVRQFLTLQRYLVAHPTVCQLYGKLKRKLMIDSHGDPLVYERAKMRFIQQAMAKSTHHLTHQDCPPRAVKRFLNLDQVKTRIWDNFSLYWITLFRYCPFVDPIPYPGMQAWLHQTSSEAMLSPILRTYLKDDEEMNAFSQFLIRECSQNPKSRSYWLSPFDQPQEVLIPLLHRLKFKFEYDLLFHVIPCMDFEVYDDSQTHILRLTHSSELQAWSALIANGYGCDALKDFYISIPSKLYDHGEPIELYLVYPHAQARYPVGAFALHLYRDGMGIVELSYSESSTLRHIVNFTVQRAHALNYTYVFTQTLKRCHEALQALGFTHLFNLQYWRR